MVFVYGPAFYLEVHQMPPKKNEKAMATSNREAWRYCRGTLFGAWLAVLLRRCFGSRWKTLLDETSLESRIALKSVSISAALEAAKATGSSISGRVSAFFSIRDFSMANRRSRCK